METPRYQLPKPFRVVNEKGQITEQYGRLHRDLIAMLLSEYGDASFWKQGKPHPGTGKRQDIPKPIADPAEWVQKRFLPSRDFEQRHVRELAGKLHRVLHEHEHIGEFVPRDDQIAHLGHEMMSIPSGNKTQSRPILSLNPWGWGKTLEMRAHGQAFVDQALRFEAEGGKPGLGVFVTAKPYFMMQQAFSSAVRIARTPPYTTAPADVTRYYKYFVELFGKERMDEFFPRTAFRDLLLEESEEPFNARVQQILETRSMLEYWAEYPRRAELLRRLEGLAKGTNMMARGILSSPEFLPPLPKPEAKNEKIQYGNAVPDVPPERVFAQQKAWQIVKPTEVNDPVFALMASGAITNPSQAEKRKELIERIEWIGLDEALRMNERQFIEAVLRAGAKVEPMLFALQAEDQHIEGWVRTCRMDVLEAIERGILADVGFRFVGKTPQERWGFRTEESMKQFLTEYFTKCPLLAKLGEKQLCERNAVHFVHPKSLAEHALRLERELKKRRLPGKVLTYGSANADSRKDLELWFMNEEDDRRNLPHILVTSASQAGQSLDLVNTELVCLLEGTNVDAFGRLTHTNRHRQRGKGAPKNFRGICLQQLYSDSDPRKNILRALDTKGTLDAGEILWQDNLCFVSSKGRKRDAKILKGVRSPSRALLPGIHTPWKSERRGTPLTSTVFIPKTALEKRIATAAAYDVSPELLFEWAREYDFHMMTQFRARIGERIMQEIRGAGNAAQTCRVVLQRVKDYIDEFRGLEDARHKQYERVDGNGEGNGDNGRFGRSAEPTPVRIRWRV